MTTLNDIYRHYAPHKKIIKKQDVQHDDIEEFGEVTGYAMQAPLPESNGKVDIYDPSHEGKKLQKQLQNIMHYERLSEI